MTHVEQLAKVPARVGYTRVSTVAQTLDQQNAALAAAGVTKTFSDTMSGARDDRPGLAALLDYLRESTIGAGAGSLPSSWLVGGFSVRGRIRWAWLLGR